MTKGVEMVMRIVTMAALLLCSASAFAEPAFESVAFGKQSTHCDEQNDSRSIMHEGRGVSLFAKSGSWVVPSTSNSLMLVVIATCILIAHYLLNISFSRLSLPIATALGPSCIVWSVLGVAVFQGVMPPVNALLGMLIYAAGMGALIAESKKEIKVAKTR